MHNTAAGTAMCLICLRHGTRQQQHGNRQEPQTLSTSLDVCLPALRSGHAILLCAASTLTDDHRKVSNTLRPVSPTASSGEPALRGSSCKATETCRIPTHCFYFPTCACQPCAMATLIFSLSPHLQQMIRARYPECSSSNRKVPRLRSPRHGSLQHH